MVGRWKQTTFVPKMKTTECVARVSLAAMAALFKPRLGRSAEFVCYVNINIFIVNKAALNSRHSSLATPCLLQVT